tara:strand:+ start:3550 stop:3753 length:204 start_codon:yes stop_codon:yes gene_type:complete
LQFASATNTSQKLQKSMSLPTLASLRKEKASVQHRIKLIAGFSLFMKVLADFKSVFYLLTLVLETRN